MRLLWIIVVSLGHADPRYTANRSARKWIQSFSVPWVGVLSHRETKSSREAISGITLIKTKLGLSNAYDVAHITKTNIRNTTKAMFLAQEGVVRYASVTHFVIHPEFNEDTLNTIALVHLDYDEDKFDYMRNLFSRWPKCHVSCHHKPQCWSVFTGVLMDWPEEYEQMQQQLGNVYAFGYVHDHAVLEQVMHTMEFVNLRECNEFYKQEDLDSQWISPTEYQCFRKKFSAEKCVFESGMTLAVHHLRRWKLLGISVLGLGCALPARFIEFAPYVPWVQQQTAGQHRDTHVSKLIRRGLHPM